MGDHAPFLAPAIYGRESGSQRLNEIRSSIHRNLQMRVPVDRFFLRSIVSVPNETNLAGQPARP